MDKNCGSCQFADPGVLSDGDMILWCKRFPPFIFHDPEDGLLTQSPGPQVNETDWCGEWKAKEEL